VNRSNRGVSRQEEAAKSSRDENSEAGANGDHVTVKQHLEELDRSGTNPLVKNSAAIIESFESAEKDKTKLDKDTLSDESKRKSAALTKKIEKTKTLVAMVKCFLVSTGYDNNGPSSASTKTQATKCADAHKPKRQNQPCVRFACPLVDMKLRPYATSPSKGNKKKMKQTAVQLCGEMELIWSKWCHDVTFLSDDAEKEPAV
jgi:hypothetical protein